MALCQHTPKGEPAAGALVRFSLPLILSGVLQQLYNWADAFIVGNTEGDLSLAAIGAAGSVLNLYVLAVTGFTLGLSILFAQTYGSGAAAELPRLLSTFSAVLGGAFLVLAAAGTALTAPLLRLMDTTPDTFSLAEGYLQTVFWGTPFLAVYNVYSAALRGVGDSRAPFWSVLVSSLVNLALDGVFVIGLSWGVRGAAAATVLSQGAMTAFLAAYTAKKHALFRRKPGERAVDRTVLRHGLRLGVPLMVQSCVSALGNVLLQRFMNGFGTQTVTAVTTAYRVDSILLLPILNLGSGISTLTAQSRGAEDLDRARRVLSSGVGLMAAVSVSLTVFIVIFGGKLIGMFGVSPAAAAAGHAFFRRIAGFYVVYGMATAVRGYLEGLGDAAYSSGVGMLALGGRIAASYLMASAAGEGIIAYAEVFSWWVMLALYAGRALWRRRRQDPVR